MTDTQDLIAQLRLGASISRDRNLNLDFAKVADQAADKLEAAQAEIERLEEKYLVEGGMRRLATGERDAALERLAEIDKGPLGFQVRRAIKAEDALKAAQAEIERLKESEQAYCELAHEAKPFVEENIKMRARLAELEEALVYAAHIGHGTPQHMTPEGMCLFDNDGVQVRLPDGRMVFAGRTPQYLRDRYAAAGASPVEPADAINDAVNKFLGWKLPRDFSPDCLISFNADSDYFKQYPQEWPIGTNLLTADQARSMFEHCLAGASPVQPSQAGELSDAEALNFMEHDRGERVLSIGSGWYSRSSYGKPLKRFDKLRCAIIAAINAKGVA